MFTVGIFFFLIIITIIMNIYIAVSKIIYIMLVF
jgi:hypothetical protein